MRSAVRTRSSASHFPRGTTPDGPAATAAATSLARACRSRVAGAPPPSSGTARGDGTGANGRVARPAAGHAIGGEDQIRGQPFPERHDAGRSGGHGGGDFSREGLPEPSGGVTSAVERHGEGRRYGSDRRRGGPRSGRGGTRRD